MFPYSEIPELAELESGRSLIRVPMEQNVPFTPRVRALVDTEEFQRLGEISQLGLVRRVYPGARHTRFEHALGVYHNALRYLRQLGCDERFRTLVTPQDAELLIVSSLLHDLGHWPFCHPIEDMSLPALPPHEAYASRFLAAGGELAAVLEREWNVRAQDVCDLLTGQVQSPARRLLRSILSGPIDVDKMDYLERDSLHCGVPYGRNFDKQRLIQSLVLNERGDGLAITSKGKTAAELMVFARYVMFSEVYWHHAVRAATSMFARAFFHLHGDLDVRKLFAMTDAEMIAELRTAARGTDSEPLLEGVFGRRRSIYKRAAEYSHDQHAAAYAHLARRPFGELAVIAGHLAAHLAATTGTAVRSTDVLIDAPPPHREIEFAVDVHFSRGDTYRSLRSVSPVVDALARTQFDDYVKRVRIFVAPHLLSAARSAPWDEWILRT